MQLIAQRGAAIVHNPATRIISHGKLGRGAFGLALACQVTGKGAFHIVSLMICCTDFYTDQLQTRVGGNVRAFCLPLVVLQRHRREWTFLNGPECLSGRFW